MSPISTKNVNKRRVEIWQPSCNALTQQPPVVKMCKDLRFGVKRSDSVKVNDSGAVTVEGGRGGLLEEGEKRNMERTGRGMTGDCVGRETERGEGLEKV